MKEGERIPSALWLAQSYRQTSLYKYKSNTCYHFRCQSLLIHRKRSGKHTSGTLSIPGDLQLARAGRNTCLRIQLQTVPQIQLRRGAIFSNGFNEAHKWRVDSGWRRLFIDYTWQRRRKRCIIVEQPGVIWRHSQT